MKELLTSGLYSIDTMLHASFSQHADNVALIVSGKKISYSSLLSSSLKLYGHLPSNSRIGILCSRSESCFAGIISAVLAGSAYVPLNKRFPAERIESILDKTGCSVIIADDSCADQLNNLLQIKNDLKIIYLHGQERIDALRVKYKNATWLTAKNKKSYEPSSVSQLEDELYILFTSGTTGEPKGIIVSHGNLSAYLRNIFSSFDINEKDIATQLFDTSFDVSVHDIFSTLLVGATLLVIPEDDVLAPAKYIKEENVTLWFSVPSVPMFMDKFRMLTENAFPSLRISFFAGESLPSATMQKWRVAAPNTRIINMYGPTETTIVMTQFECLQDHNLNEYLNDIVPIGTPFEDCDLLILGGNGEIVDENESGELYIGGPQVTLGYLGNKPLTDTKYVRIAPGSDSTYYKSGDLVKFTKYGYQFISRIDDQVQLRGFRVELAEIDKVIRKAASHDLAISIPIGLKGSRADELYAVIQGEKDKDLSKMVLGQCKMLLPDYMVPSKVRFIESMPLNVNGKIDRKALMVLYDDE